MAAQLLQTDLSLFWGLLRVSAKLKSPPQQTLTNGNASTEALIPLNNGQPTAAAEASSPASAAHTDEQTLVERKFSISVGTEMGAEDVSSVQPIMSSPAQALGIHESQHAKLPEEVIPSQKRQPKSKRSVSSSTRPASSLSGMKEGTEAQLSRQSAQEKAAFDSFRSLCAAKGLLKSPIGIGSKDVPEGINDDATLLRFFNARKQDVGDAHRQFAEACRARDVNQLYSFYENVDVHDFEETRNLYPQWLGRRDKRGLPIYFYDFAKIDSSSVNTHKKSSAATQPSRPDSKTTPGLVSTDMLRAFLVYEHLTRFVMPFCSAITLRENPDIAVTKMLVIVDISNITVRQVWSLRGYLQDLGKIFSVNYPEVLDRVLVIGAPSYFPTIFAWVKRWIDPGTVAKLDIVPSNAVLPTLQAYVDMENIPRRFGGDFEYSHGMPIQLDADLQQLLTWVPPHSGLPTGPLKWTDDGKGTAAVVSLGKSKGKQNNEEIATLRTRELKGKKRRSS